MRTLIRRRKLPPPGPDAPGWPWPLALRTFGDFEIAREGVPLVSKGKAQKKPLELLKALVAHGGRGVDAAMLTALLWPDAEGDDAKTSFDSNLYRLRKLVDIDGRRAARGRQAVAQPGAGLPSTRGRSRPRWRPATSTRRSRSTAGISSRSTRRSPWALAVRDRLQAKLIRAVLAAGDAYERERQWDRARALYERTLEVDNLAEAIYRRLMICQREAGDPAGALTTYRRCRELLSIVLARTPSPETEAVRQTL